MCRVKCNPSSCSHLERLAVLKRITTSPQDYCDQRTSDCMCNIHVPLHVNLHGISQQQMDPEESEVEIVSGCFHESHVSASIWKN